MAGTYRCECPTGYSLLPNQRDCARGGNLFYIQLQIMSRSNHFYNNSNKDENNNYNNDSYNINISNKLLFISVGVSPCQRNNGGCEQVCTHTQSSAICSCRAGYQLFNGRSCRGTQPVTVVAC